MNNSKRSQRCAAQLADRTVSTFFIFLFYFLVLCTQDAARALTRGETESGGSRWLCRWSCCGVSAGWRGCGFASAAGLRSSARPGHGAVASAAAAVRAQCSPFIWAPLVGGRQSSHININAVSSCRRAPPSRAAQRKNRSSGSHQYLHPQRWESKSTKGWKMI